MDIHVNEIRDFLNRAPKRKLGNGPRFFNPAVVRYRWMAEISSGSIDVRIQRRAGLEDRHADYYKPIRKAIARNRQKKGFVTTHSA